MSLHMSQAVHWNTKKFKEMETHVFRNNAVKVFGGGLFFPHQNGVSNHQDSKSIIVILKPMATFGIFTYFRDGWA